MWRVTDRLGIYIQSENGGRRTCSHMVIRPGDFVDVTVVADIVRPASSSNLSVKFSLVQVVLLQSGAIAPPVSG